MMFLTRIVWLIFCALLVFRGVALLLRGIARVLGTSALNSARPADSTCAVPTSSERHLVRDPVCGMHLAEVLAIPLRDRGELLHFCSVACRDKYASRMDKAATG
jgi:YHS domain-containing protein